MEKDKYVWKCYETNRREEEREGNGGSAQYRRRWKYKGDERDGCRMGISGGDCEADM